MVVLMDALMYSSTLLMEVGDGLLEGFSCEHCVGTALRAYKAARTLEMLKITQQ
jgi:hypothetical protein